MTTPAFFGKLTSNIQRAKQLETWTFTPPSGVQLSKREVQVSIRKGQEVAFEFVATAKDFAEAMVDSDLSRLFSRVESAYSAYFRNLVGLQWEAWLEVTVKGSDDDQMAHRLRECQRKSADITICYRILNRAIGLDGKPVLLMSNNGYEMIVPFPQPKRMGVVSERPMGIRMQDDHQEYAYMPATPENILALDNLISGLAAARQKIADLANGAQQGLPWNLPQHRLLGVSTDE